MLAENVDGLVVDYEFAFFGIYIPPELAVNRVKLKHVDLRSS